MARWTATATVTTTPLQVWSRSQAVRLKRKVGSRSSWAALRQKEEVDARHAHNRKLIAHGQVDGRIQPRALGQLAASDLSACTTRLLIILTPLPVDGEMDGGRDQHQHPGPGVELAPGVAAEQDRHAIHRVAPTLVATGGQEEKIDPG